MNASRFRTAPQQDRRKHDRDELGGDCQHERDGGELGPAPGEPERRRDNPERRERIDVAAVSDFEHHERVPGVGQRQPFRAPGRGQPTPQHDDRQEVAGHERELHRQRRVADHHDQPEEELCRRRVWRPIAAARHAHRLIGVRMRHRRIGGQNRVWAVAEQLHPSIPLVAHHVAVGTDRCDGHRNAQNDGGGESGEQQAPGRERLAPDPDEHRAVSNRSPWRRPRRRSASRAAPWSPRAR